MTNFFKITVLSLLIYSCSSNKTEEEVALSEAVNTEINKQQLKKKSRNNTRRIIAGKYELTQSSTGIHRSQSIKLRFRTDGPLIESVNSPYCFDFNASLRKIDANPTRVGSKYMGEIGFYSLLLLQHVDQETLIPIECDEAEQILENFAPFLWNADTVLYNVEDPTMITKFTYDTSSEQLTLLSEDNETTKFVFSKIE